MSFAHWWRRRRFHWPHAYDTPPIVADGVWYSPNWFPAAWFNYRWFP